MRERWPTVESEHVIHASVQRRRSSRVSTKRLSAFATSIGSTYFACSKTSTGTPASSSIVCHRSRLGGGRRSSTWRSIVMTTTISLLRCCDCETTSAFHMEIRTLIDWVAPKSRNHDAMNRQLPNCSSFARTRCRRLDTHRAAYEAIISRRAGAAMFITRALRSWRASLLGCTTVAVAKLRPPTACDKDQDSYNRKYSHRAERARGAPAQPRGIRNAAANVVVRDWLGVTSRSRLVFGESACLPCRPTKVSCSSYRRANERRRKLGAAVGIVRAFSLKCHHATGPGAS